MTLIVDIVLLLQIVVKKNYFKYTKIITWHWQSFYKKITKSLLCWTKFVFCLKVGVVIYLQFLIGYGILSYR